MKFLILAHRWDASAAAVAAALRRRHPAHESRLVTLEELIFAPSWAHRVDSGGVVSEVRLHDGCVLRSDETGVVLHRLGSFDLPQFGKQDRSYAVAEMSALLLSWLEGFPCPVINPVTPRGFCLGRSPVRWLALAAEAGLPLPRMRLTSNLRRFPADGLQSADSSLPSVTFPIAGRSAAFLAEPPGPETHSVLLAGEDVCGDLPPGLLSACRAFARLADALVLRLNFTSGGRHGPRWIFSSAEPIPVLDANELSAVVQLMERVADEDQSVAKVA